jgi:hypothetical protein
MNTRQHHYLSPPRCGRRIHREMSPPALFARIVLTSCLLPIFIGCGSNPANTQPVKIAPVSRPATRPVRKVEHRDVAPATTTTISSDAFPPTSNPRDTVPFLASDALAGRLPGSPGINRAADFLAAELSRMGLRPLPGRSDYFQSFNMPEASTLARATYLALNGQDLLLSKDYAPMSLSAEQRFSGPVLFAGFGITRPPDDASHYDDYEGVDARGKVVMAMMKEPLNERSASRFGGTPWSNSSLFTVKVRNAADHGAVALLLVAPPSSGGGDMVNLFSGGSENPSAIPVYQITRRVANVILSMGNAEDLKTIQEVIYSSFKPHSLDLSSEQIAGEVALRHGKTGVRNVMAYLPGIGPHADEWVVVGAHYDHLGKGQLGHMVGGRIGEIWHGADDNASGTSAVLELAERMKKTGPLPRSVLFIFFTAEEEGLIGSKYFVEHPLIPIDKVVAMLNLDMVGRLRNNSLQVGGIATASDLDAMVKSAVAGTGLITSTPDPEDGGRGGLGPSDHASFAAHKIPVLFLFTGLHSDYHKPADTADKINYDGIDKLVEVSERIVTAMASMPWQKYDGTADAGMMRVMLPGGGSEHRAVLGVVPDETSGEATTGVPISGVVHGQAAEEAGLKPGDVIVGLNSKQVKTLGDLSESLDSAHGGDKVVVKVLRDGKALELNAVLR